MTRTLPATAVTSSLRLDKRCPSRKMRKHSTMASGKRVGRTFLSDAFLNLRGDTTEVKISTLRKPRRVGHPHVPVEACMAAPMLRFYPHLSAKKMRLEKYREAWHLMKPGPPRVGRTFLSDTLT